MVSPPVVSSPSDPLPFTFQTEVQKSHRWLSLTAALPSLAPCCPLASSQSFLGHKTHSAEMAARIQILRLLWDFKLAGWGWSSRISIINKHPSWFLCSGMCGKHCAYKMLNPHLGEMSVWGHRAPLIVSVPTAGPHLWAWIVGAQPACALELGSRPESLFRTPATRQFRLLYRQHPTLWAGRRWDRREIFFLSFVQKWENNRL